jgi:ELWxxDGT repeat protein
LGSAPSNGTAAGTTEIVGIAGTAATGVNPSDITVFNSKALFNGASSANTAGPAGHLGRWTTNGTAAGTQELGGSTGISGAATTGLDPTDMTVFGSEVLFNGVDASGLTGLWVTDGTAGGTHELAGISGAPTTGSGVNPTDLTVFGSEVLFNGLDASGDMGLWVTDGTAAGTHELTGIANVAATGLAPSDMTVFKGEVLFSGIDIHNKQQLWETNGTAAGTFQLSTITTPGTFPAQGLQPSNLEGYNGQVLFRASLRTSPVRSPPPSAACGRRMARWRGHTK